MATATDAMVAATSPCSAAAGGDDEQGQSETQVGGTGSWPEGTNQMPKPDGPQPDAQPAGRPSPDGSTSRRRPVRRARRPPATSSTAKSSWWHEHPDRAHQAGEVTEFTAGQSLTVKSADGFTATYAVTADTAGATSALTVGAIAGHRRQGRRQGHPRPGSSRRAPPTDPARLAAMTARPCGAQWTSPPTSTNSASSRSVAPCVPGGTPARRSSPASLQTHRRRRARPAAHPVAQPDPRRPLHLRRGPLASSRSPRSPRQRQPRAAPMGAVAPCRPRREPPHGRRHPPPATGLVVDAHRHHQVCRGARWPVSHLPRGQQVRHRCALRGGLAPTCAPSRCPSRRSCWRSRLRVRHGRRSAAAAGLELVNGNAL